MSRLTIFRQLPLWLPDHTTFTTQTTLFMTAEVGECQTLHCTQEFLSPTHRKGNKGGAAKVSNMGDSARVYMPTKAQVLHSCITLHAISTV